MKYKKALLTGFLLSIILLTLGYLFREELLMVNIHDTYYVITYINLAIFMTEFLWVIILIILAVRWVKHRRINSY